MVLLGPGSDWVFGSATNEWYGKCPVTSSDGVKVVVVGYL